MAQQTTKAWTMDDKAIREDLLDVLTNIDPTEASFMDLVQNTEAHAVLHEWPTDTLDTTADNANIEGADAGTVSMTNPTRIQNLVQNFQKPYTISGTEMAVNTAGFADRKAYEVKKKMKALKNDMEFAFIRGTGATGNGTNTATRLKGVKTFISTNATSQSGVTFKESDLISYLANSWNKGGKIDTIFTGSVLKQRVDGFSGNNQRFVGADEKSLVNTINYYSSSFGAPVINVKLHRFLTISGDTNNDILGLQTDTWATSWLRKPSNTDLAKTGDAYKGLLVAEATIESRAEQANFIGKAHL